MKTVCTNRTRILRFLLFTLTLTGLFHAPQGHAEDVHVYSARQEQLIAPFLKDFTDKTGIKVTLLTINKGLLDRIRQEGELSPADMVLTSDLPTLITAAEEGLMAKIEDSTLEGIVPPHLRDPQGQWFGLSQRVRLLYSHRERVADAAPSDVRDLADPKWRGRICIRSGYHNYNLTLFAALRAHFGHAALKTFLIGLKKNLAYKPQGNDRFQVKSIYQGVCDLSLGNSYYYGLMLNDDEQRPWAESVTPIFAKLGNFGHHVNVSAAGILRHTPNKEEALRLLQYLLSDKAQELYAARTFEYPVAKGIAPDPLVASWGTIKADTMSLAEISTHRRPTLMLLQELGFDQ